MKKNPSENIVCGQHCLVAKARQRLHKKENYRPIFLYFWCSFRFIIYYWLLFIHLFFSAINSFVFFIFKWLIFSFIAGLQSSVNFLLYSKVTESHTHTHTHTHTHMYILFLTLSSMMLHYKWLDTVPSAKQQDLIAYPFQRQ